MPVALRVRHEPSGVGRLSKRDSRKVDFGSKSVPLRRRTTYTEQNQAPSTSTGGVVDDASVETSGDERDQAATSSHGSYDFGFITIASNIQHDAERETCDNSRAAHPVKGIDRENPYSTSYHYAPLDGEDSLRILRLHGEDDPDAPIRITLQTITFEECNVDDPPYEALSYVWGLEVADEPIYVADEGGTNRGTLAVSRNLECALRGLRWWSGHDRTLWIDAICINQQDLLERSKQVKRMGDVYTLAHRVTVWLGPEAPDSSVAFDTFFNLADVMIDWIFETMRPSPRTSELRQEDLEHPIYFYRRQAVESMYSLLSRTWFDRLWIWQEIQLAPESSILTCGNGGRGQFIRWDTFSAAIFRLWKQGIECPEMSPTELRAVAARIEQIIPICREVRAEHLEELMESSKRAQCTDQRDRVYGVMSLLPPTPKLDFVPDYTKTVEEVYQDVVLALMKAYRSCDILRWCQLHSTPDTTHIPSWVPDWSHPKCNPLSEFRASLSASAEYAYVGDGVVQITGRYITTIEGCHRPKITQLSSETEILIELRALFAAYSNGEAAASPTSFADFFRMLVQDHFADRHVPPKPALPFLSSALSLLWIALIPPNKHLKEPYHPEVSKYLKLVRHTLVGRCIFTTNDGYLGLAPSCAQRLDQIIVLLGCNSVMAARPHTQKRYKLVGEAYYSRFTSGEAILGPLPDHVELLQILTKHLTGVPLDNKYITALVDRGTRMPFSEDPRLDNVPLPEGWRRSHPREYDLASFVNEKTDEAWWVHYMDPRLLPDELRKRGIALQQFVFE